MPGRKKSTSQPYLSLTQRAAAKWASPAALAQFRRQVWDHDIPTGGQTVSYGSSTWQTGNFETFPSVHCLPFRPSHSVVLTLAQLAFHNCIDCPLINFPEDSGNPPNEFHFHLAPISESHPPSDVKSSPSSFMAKLQSSCRNSALSSSVAKLQLSSRYNSRSDDSSNPHSPGLNSWQSDRSSNQSSDSDDRTHPHSPGLDPWQNNGSVGEGKGSSSGVYDCETDNGQVSQGSGGSSSSSKG
jgi:hypothetical protein